MMENKIFVMEYWEIIGACFIIKIKNIQFGDYFSEVATQWLVKSHGEKLKCT